MTSRGGTGGSEFELGSAACCLFWACLNLVIIYLAGSVNEFSIFWGTFGYYSNALKTLKMFYSLKDQIIRAISNHEVPIEPMRWEGVSCVIWRLLVCVMCV
jgi:hypothetical protein